VTCPDCGEETVKAPVPQAFAAYLPDDRPGIALCTHCLSVSPIDDPPSELPAFDAVAAGFPRDPEKALPIVLMLALLDSLALYRSELDTLAEITERRGVDPLLVLDRLAADQSLEPGFDLDRRRHQLAQLLS
jgi:hypothetical protein